MWKKRLIIGGMLLIGFLMLLAACMIIRKKTLSQKERIIRKWKELGMSQKSAEIAAAISAHETAGYTSTLSKKPYNNFFGMHMPAGNAEQMARRKTLAIGKDENNWAKFSSLEDSVEDFYNWFGYYGSAGFGDNVDTVVGYMKAKSYFEDKLDNYLRGVKSWL